MTVEEENIDLDYKISFKSIAYTLQYLVQI